MINAPAINNTGIDWADILNSKYGGFAILAGSLLAAFGFVELSSAISKGMEKGYNMEAGSEKYGTLKFTIPTASEVPAETKQSWGNTYTHEQDQNDTEQAEHEEP